MPHPLFQMDAAEKHPKKKTCILSIDGGGIRGIIPATILVFLEKELQRLDGPDVRIADYFDVIAGTSTGGIIAGILTTPNEKGRPKFDANDVLNFYLTEGTPIFADRGISPLNELTGPKHDSDNLRQLLRENLQDLKIKDTFTELLVPAFDIQLMQPTYFSTSIAKEDESKNAYVSDVLLGTSAAPTYFPPHVFQTVTSSGETHTYNLIDGGVGINNPSHLSLAHTIQQQSKQRNERPISIEDYENILLLSLGTGKASESYDGTDAKSWGVLPWVVKDGKSPLLDIVLECSADVAEYNLTVFFSVLECAHNYLRIQAYNIPKEVQAMDNAKNDNIQRLKELGVALLDELLAVLNLDNGDAHGSRKGYTNRDALLKFAERLSYSYNAKKLL